MKNSGRVLTRDALLDKVWGVEYYGDARTVDVHIRYLRQKIEDEPDRPNISSLCVGWLPLQSREEIA